MTHNNIFFYQEENYIFFMIDFFELLMKITIHSSKYELVKLMHVPLPFLKPPFALELFFLPVV